MSMGVALAALAVLVAIIYIAFLFGQWFQEDAANRQEQLDIQAYNWAIANNRLPTRTVYVDTETGEVI